MQRGLKIPSSIFDRLLWPALLALLAVAGYLLVTLPPVVVARWRDLAVDHPIFSTVYLGLVSAGALLMLFVWGWLVLAIIARLRIHRTARRHPPPSKLTTAQQERETRRHLAAAERTIERAEAGRTPLDDDRGRDLRRQVEDLRQKIERRRLEIVAFGAISSGKSALLNALLGEERFATDARGGTTLSAQEVPLSMEGQEEGRVILRDTPGLGEVLGQRRADAAAEHAREADLVLFVISGALRDFEFEALRSLVAMEKRILICLNKEDWYTTEDFDAVLRQVREQIQNLPGRIAAEDVLPVRARPSAQKRVRILADGSAQEESVFVPPDISALAERLRAVIVRDGRDLLLANLLLRSRAVAAAAKTVRK